MSLQRSKQSTLTSLLYRSKATAPVSHTDLTRLAGEAQRRNRLRRVTGALFYDDGRFFQWLEGPEKSVAELFSTIEADDRHTDIEIVSAGPLQSRVFSDWGLRLFRRRQDIPRQTQLAEPCDACDEVCSASTEVARDLMQGERGSFVAALKATRGDIELMVCFCEKLMQSFADLLATDECSSIDKTIGYALALSILREQMATTAHVPWPRTASPVLVVPVPGEPNYLRAELATLALENAGIPAVYKLPDRDTDLADELDGSRYAGVVIVSRGAPLQERRLNSFRELCDAARRCGGPQLKIALYGQLPTDLDDFAGTDHRCNSALCLPRCVNGESARIH